MRVVRNIDLQTNKRENGSAGVNSELHGRPPEGG